MTMRVLVFDDDEATGRLVIRVAKLVGLEASAVTNTADFQHSLVNAPPQIIVLDLQLGPTDGIEQLRFLAERQFNGLLVLISGFDNRVLTTAGTVAENLGLNITATIAKPIAVEALEQVLQRLQRGRQPLTAADLLAAIRENEMCLEFQPIVTRQPKVLRKLEALIRWDHPTLGRVSPNDFMPIAENNREIMDALTDWVIGATVEAYQVLSELDMNVPIAANISTQNLHDLTLPDRLAERLESAGVPAGHLYLEVTETAASQDINRMMDILTRIRLKGMRLAIDDFGTGYSSLRALRQLPFSEIKIDQSFVKDVTTSRDSRAIVKSIVDLAANLEMDCVAEGVETEETAGLLQQLGVHILQGYLIAPPMPIEAVPAWWGIWMPGESDSHRSELSPSPRDDAGVATAASQATVMEPPRTAPPVKKLSQRQLEVMRLLTAGCSIKEIARKLDLSLGTVKVHLSMAYSALGARNRIEAVMRARLAIQELEATSA